MRDVLGPFAVAGLALALRLYFIAYESRIEPIFDAAIYWQQGQTMRAWFSEPWAGWAKPLEYAALSQQGLLPVLIGSLGRFCPCGPEWWAAFLPCSTPWDAPWSC